MQVPRSVISCSQLTTSPSLPLSWPRPISSKPEPSRTALISGLQAHTDSQLPTHGPSHAHYRSQTRRHALPLHTCSNTTPPKHSPDQNGHGLPPGGPGSLWIATALGSSAAVSALATTARRRQALRSVESGRSLDAGRPGWRPVAGWWAESSQEDSRVASNMKQRESAQRAQTQL